MSEKTIIHASPLWTVTIHGPWSAMEGLEAFFEPLCLSLSWFEKAPFDPQWVMDVLMAKEPCKDSLEQAMNAQGLAYDALTIAPLPQKDWLVENRRTFQPIHVGPFVIHDSYTHVTIPAKGHGLVVDACTAFGTGHHDTTRFCLELMLVLKDRGFTPQSVLDLGCGTGILGMAAQKLWPGVSLVLTDNDPEALVRTDINLKKNHCVGTTVLAEGFDHPYFQTTPGQKFSLILANILAGPLVLLAPQIKDYLCPEGYGILSGIMTTQGQEVSHAYEKKGLDLITSKTSPHWVGQLYGHSRC